MVEPGRAPGVWFRSKRVHYLVAGVLGLILTVLTAGCVESLFAPAEKAKILAVLDAMEHAYLGQNRDILGRVIADNIVVVEGGQQHEYTRQQFLDAVEAGWAGKDFDIWEFQKVDIVLANGNRDAAVDAHLVTRNRGEAILDQPVKISLKKVGEDWKIVRIEYSQVGAARAQGLPTAR